MSTTQLAEPVERDWLQADCSLFPSTPIEPYIPWANLCRAINDWRQDQLIYRFWFVRKPPGLRLRFQASRRATGLQAAICRWLIDAESRNDIRGFRFTIYEPESHRFGGKAGMDAAHALFDASASLSLQFHADDSRPLTAFEFSIATTSDLLGRCLDDRAEVWDIWCRLAKVIPTATDQPSREIEVSEDYLAGLPTLFRVLGDRWAPALDDIDKAHDRVARDLRALACGGVLQVGLREWLVAATIFDWNRLGLPNQLAELKQGIDRVEQFLRPMDRVHINGNMP